MEKTKLKIAIADDHKISIEGMKVLLETFDYIEVVIEAFNGKELLEKLENIRPEIILMDVRMPLMDGIEATKIISKQYPEIKVIGISYLCSGFLVKSMMNVGAKGFISKDLRMVDYEEMFTKIFNGQVYFSKDILALLLNYEQNNFYKNKMLTPRENEVLQLVYDEFSNKEIADKLNIDYRTVETHKSTIKKKLGVKSVVGIVKFMRENLY